MNPALLLTLLFDGDGEASDVFPGPFRSVAGQNWQPGDRAGTSYQPGAVAADSYQAGDRAGENL